jgi:4'-phosphopantetheinyl transferase
MPMSSSCPDPGEICAWHIASSRLTADAGRLDRALGWLQPDERARYDRYRHRDDADMFLLGRVMARTLVGRAIGLAPQRWRWREGPRGRPEIAEPGVAIHFNLAHSAGLVACVLGYRREVGIDVEDRDRRRLARRIVARYCSPAERADIDAQGADGWHDRFLAYWTLKEAYLKARGLGIAVRLGDVNMTLDDGGARVDFLDSLLGTDARWAFHLAAPTPRHVMALAAPTAEGPATFVVRPFPEAWLP